MLNVRQTLDPTAKGQASRVSLSLPEILYVSLYGGITQNGALGLRVGGDLPEVLQNLAGHQGQKLVGWLLSPPFPPPPSKL